MMAGVAQAATLSNGYNASLLSADTVGVRYRGQSTGNEHYVGVNDLGVGANRSEGAITWAQDDYAFVFTFDSLTGKLSSTFDGGTAVTYNSTPGFVSDVLHLTLANRVKNGSTGVLTINNLTVNGEAIGSGPLTCALGPVVCEFMVTNFAVGPLLTVAGSINLTGLFDTNQSETSRFQIEASAVAPVPLPAALPLFAAALGLLGYLGWRRREA